jgi:hypothetical protein
MQITYRLHAAEFHETARDWGALPSVRSAPVLGKNLKLEKSDIHLKSFRDGGVEMEVGKLVPLVQQSKSYVFS